MPLEVKDGSQPIKIFLIILGLVLFVIFSILLLKKDSGFLGAIEIGSNLNSTSDVVTVTSTSQGIKFPKRSQAIIRQIQNLCDQDIFLSFGTSTSLELGNGGFLIRASSSQIMSIENGLLLRGDVYASSTGSCELRLFQIP